MVLKPAGYNRIQFSIVSDNSSAILYTSIYAILFNYIILYNIYIYT